jgi:DNA topoisomerase-1
MNASFANSLDGIDWDESAWALDAEFDESAIKRVSAGKEGGGQFASGGGAAGAEAGAEAGEREPVAGGEQEAGAEGEEGEEDEEEDEEAGAKQKARKSAHLVAAGENREQWPEHIRKMVIPPAWTDVQIAMSPDADLQVVGRDKKGRKQYVYSEQFKNSQAALKYARMESLRQEKPGIIGQLAEMHQSADRKLRDHADCATLVMKMGIRPGSDTDTKAEKKAYGASTLEGKHVVVENGQVFLRFTGKKGVDLNLPVEDKTLAANLASRAKKAGAEGRLFGDVYSGSLLQFVKKDLDHGGFKTKDFRTLLANELAVKAMKGVAKPKDAKQYKAAVKEVATHVSSRLGNTPTVALQSYIHPAVFGEWKGAADVPAVQAKGKKKGKAKGKKKPAAKPAEPGKLSGAALAWATRRAAKEAAHAGTAAAAAS